MAYMEVPSPPASLLHRIKFVEDHIIQLEREYPPWAALHSLLFASGLHHRARRRSSSPHTLDLTLPPTCHLPHQMLSKAQYRLHPLRIQGRP